MTTTIPHKKRQALTNEQRIKFTDAITAGMPFREALILGNIPESFSASEKQELEEIVQLSAMLNEVKQSILPKEEQLEQLLHRLPASGMRGSRSSFGSSTRSPFSRFFNTSFRPTPLSFSRVIIPVGVPLFAFFVMLTILISANPVAPVLSPQPGSLSLQGADRTIGTTEEILPVSPASDSSTREVPSLAMGKSVASESAPAPVLMSARATEVPPSMSTLEEADVALFGEVDTEETLAAGNIERVTAFSENVQLLDELSSFYDVAKF